MNREHSSTLEFGLDRDAVGSDRVKVNDLITRIADPGASFENRFTIVGQFFALNAQQNPVTEARSACHDRGQRPVDDVRMQRPAPPRRGIRRRGV
ncbi:hypothetical protein [Sorlinia euscelidii]|uniref:hypothetical protein n=1 Tax=Sorlinia euscelidii TaxID=3081148 RepID=UPI003AAF86A4